jgi:hypothetical protein
MLPTSLKLGSLSRLAFVDPPSALWSTSRSAADGANARRSELLVDVEDMMLGPKPFRFSAS